MIRYLHLNLNYQFDIYFFSISAIAAAAQGALDTLCATDYISVSWNQFVQFVKFNSIKVSVVQTICHSPRVANEWIKWAWTR